MLSRIAACLVITTEIFVITFLRLLSYSNGIDRHQKFVLREIPVNGEADFLQKGEIWNLSNYQNGSRSIG